jgi:hypothetical protein
VIVSLRGGAAADNLAGYSVARAPWSSTGAHGLVGALPADANGLMNSAYAFGDLVARADGVQARRSDAVHAQEIRVALALELFDATQSRGVNPHGQRGRVDTVAASSLTSPSRPGA